MKKSFFVRWASAFLIGAAIALGGVFTIVTAYELSVEPLGLILPCLFFSLLFPLLLSSRRWGLWMLLVLALAALWVWRDWESLRSGLLAAAEDIFWHYGRAFESLSGLEAIEFSVPEEAKSTDFFILLGAFLAFLAAWTVVGAYSLLPLAAVSGSLLLLCLMIVNRAPAPGPVMLLLGAYVLLLMSWGLSRRDPAAGQRLMLRLALPVALLLGLLCLAVKPSAYVRPLWPDQLRESVVSLANNVYARLRGEEPEEGGILGSAAYPTLGVFGWNSSPEETDLAAVGPQRKTGRRVMQVEASKSGKLYLRGYSLAVYDGTSWTTLPEESYGALAAGALWQRLPLNGAEKTLEIMTDRRSSLYYLPYGTTGLPEDALPYFDAYLENPAAVKSYALFYADSSRWAGDSEAYEAFVYDNYLQVPEETRRALAEMVEEIRMTPLAVGFINTDTIAALVADFVRSSALYDLETERMPRGEDFVSWFLTESETGYCVHFASAATVLLRCLDIPARYVSGYTVEARGGSWTPVTQDNAHAWVEYYVSGEGWKMLEATPADLRSEEEPGPAPEATAEPEETPAQPTPEVEATPAPTPSGGILDRPGTVDGKGGEVKWNLSVPGWLWLLLALAALPLLWRGLARRLRKARLERGTVNERALGVYRHIRRLCRCMGRKIPAEALRLAEKARFSRSGVSEAELKALLARAEGLQKEAREEPNPIRRLVCRLAFGL